MIRKTLISLLVLCIFSSCIYIVPIRASDEISVICNGTELEFDVEPVIINGRVMVPMRTLLEAMGLNVIYYPTTKTISVFKNCFTILLNLGSAYASLVNSAFTGIREYFEIYEDPTVSIITDYYLDAPPLVIDNRTFVPLRFISETTGAMVSWNNVNKTVSVEYVNDLEGKYLNTKILTTNEMTELMESRCLTIEYYDEDDNLVSVGSGFLINRGGKFVTCYHAAEGMSKIVAVTGEGRRFDIKYIASLDELNDIIVFNISFVIGDMDFTQTPYLVFGNSDMIKTGEEIYTYGSPLGISNTISEGIISNRSVEIEGNEYIMFTASSAPGSGGSPLVSNKGEVFGMTCMIFVEGQNMNLAVPGNKIGSLVKELSLSFNLAYLSSQHTKIIYDDGNYICESSDGKRQGTGSMYWNSGDKSQGSWDQDKMFYGLYKYANGNMFLGSFENDMKQGYGVFLWNDGSYLSGYWDKDVYIGE